MMKLQDVLLKAMAKKISWLEAAEIIGVCDRNQAEKADSRPSLRMLWDPRNRYEATALAELSAELHW